MIVWNGRLPGASRLGCPGSSVKQCAAVLEHDSGAGRHDERAEADVEALDQRARVALLVHRTQVDRASALEWPGRRRACPRGIDQLAPRGEVVVVEVALGQWPVVDVPLRVGERQLHRLGLEVHAIERAAARVVEPREDAQRLQRRHALAVGRNLAHVHAAVVLAQRLDPFGVRHVEVVLHQRRDLADRVRHRAAIEAVGPVARDSAQRRRKLGKPDELTCAGRREEQAARLLELLERGLLRRPRSARSRA